MPCYGWTKVCNFEKKKEKKKKKKKEKKNGKKEFKGAKKKWYSQRIYIVMSL